MELSGCLHILVRWRFAEAGKLHTPALSSGSSPTRGFRWSVLHDLRFSDGDLSAFRSRLRKESLDASLPQQEVAAYTLSLSVQSKKGRMYPIDGQMQWAIFLPKLLRESGTRTKGFCLHARIMREGEGWDESRLTDESRGLTCSLYKSEHLEGESESPGQGGSLELGGDPNILGTNDPDAVRDMREGRHFVAYAADAEGVIRKQDIFLFYEDTEALAFQSQGCLYWCPAATRVAVSSHAIPLATITDLVIGKGTKDLRSSAAHGAPKSCCFSIVGVRDRLDLEAESAEVVAMWVGAINGIRTKSGQRLERSRILDESNLTPSLPMVDMFPRGIESLLKNQMTADAKQKREIKRLLRAAQRVGAGVQDLPMSLTEVRRLQKRVRARLCHQCNTTVRMLENAQDEQGPGLALKEWKGAHISFRAAIKTSSDSSAHYRIRDMSVIPPSTASPLVAYGDGDGDSDGDVDGDGDHHTLTPSPRTAALHLAYHPLDGSLESQFGPVSFLTGGHLVGCDPCPISIMTEDHLADLYLGEAQHENAKSSALPPKATSNISESIAPAERSEMMLWLQSAPGVDQDVLALDFTPDRPDMYVRDLIELNDEPGLFVLKAAGLEELARCELLVERPEQNWEVDVVALRARIEVLQMEAGLAESRQREWSELLTSSEKIHAIKLQALKETVEERKVSNDMSQQLVKEQKVLLGQVAEVVEAMKMEEKERERVHVEVLRDKRTLSEMAVSFKKEIDILRQENTEIRVVGLQAEQELRGSKAESASLRYAATTRMEALAIRQREQENEIVDQMSEMTRLKINAKQDEARHSKQLNANNEANAEKSRLVAKEIKVLRMTNGELESRLRKIDDGRAEMLQARTKELETMQAAERELERVCEERNAERRAAVLAFEDLKTTSTMTLVAAQEAAMETAGLVSSQHDAEIAIARFRVETLTKEQEEQRKHVAALGVGRDRAAVQMLTMATKMNLLESEAQVADKKYSEQLKDAKTLAAEMVAESDRRQAWNQELEASLENERERLWMLKDQVATSDQQWRAFVLEVEEQLKEHTEYKARVSESLRARTGELVKMQQLYQEKEKELRLSVVILEELKTSSSVELASTQEAAMELASIISAQHAEELAAASLRTAMLTKELVEQAKRIVDLAKQGAVDMAEVLQGLRAAKADIERLQATNLALEIALEEVEVALEQARKYAAKFEQAAKDADEKTAMTVAAPRNITSPSCCRRFLLLFMLLVIGIVACGFLVRRVRHNFMFPYASGSDTEFWHRVSLDCKRQDAELLSKLDHSMKAVNL